MANSAPFKVFNQEVFWGGIADGSKRGYEGAYQDGRGLDFRTDTDKLTTLKRLAKVSGSTVTDMIKWSLDNQGTQFFYGDTGKIYRQTSAGVWSNPKTVSSSTGQGLGLFNDELWYASATSIGKATTPNATGTYTDDYFVTPQYEAPDVYSVTAGNEYTTPAAVSEVATAKYTWTPTVSHIAGIEATVTARGTGDWTFIIHDASNNNIGQLTVVNADLPATAAVCRVMLSSYNITAGQSYHIHIISTGADGKVRTNVANDLSTMEISIFQTLKDADVDQSLTPPSTELSALTAASYSVTTAINEAENHRLAFTPNTSSLSAIALIVNGKGSANLTLTVHNPNNEIIGTATLSNANLRARGCWVQVRFSTPLSLTPGIEYHVHATANTASQIELADTTNNDFSTAYFKTHFQILESDSNYHTMTEFLNLLCVGNAQFLTTIDDSEVLTREQLTFPQGEKVRCLAALGNFLAISTWRGDDIGSYGKGRIYFWDGTSPQFTDFIEVDGQVNAMINAGDNSLLIAHGTEGNISLYNGGITLLKRIKGVGENKTIEVYPQALAMWERIARIGISAGTSTTADRLVWSYGKRDKDFPFALSKDYPISTGNFGSTVQISSILGLSATKFLVAWKDGSIYGVDNIDVTTDQSSSFMQTLRFDGKLPFSQKGSIAASMYFEPITATQKITLAYRFDNSGSFVTLGTVDGTNALDLGIQYKSFPLNFDWFEIELKVTLETQGGGTDAPKLLNLAMNYIPMTEFQIERK